MPSLPRYATDESPARGSMFSTMSQFAQTIRCLSLPNVVLTPHNAGTTAEVIDLGLARAVENVARFVGPAPSS